MAAPTLVSVYGFPTLAAAGVGTNFATTVTAAIGDRLVAVAIGTGSPPTFSTPTVPTGSGISWTLERSSTASSNTPIYVWTGTVGTAFSSQSIGTTAVTGNSGEQATFGVYRWSGSAGFGVSGITTTNTGAPSLSAVLALNSGIVLAYGDYNTLAAPTFLTNAGAVAVDANSVNDSRVGAAHHLSSGSAGTKALGTSAPTGAKATFAYLEVLASGALVAGPAADPVGITDAVARVLGASRTLADPIGITDIVKVGPGKLLADPIGITDIVTIGKGSRPADPIGITDTISAQRTVAKTIADALPITDNVVIDFVRIPIQDFQFVVPDHSPYVPFGRGQAVDVSKFIPGSFDTRNQDQNAPRGDYRVFGTDRKAPPTWGWDMWTNCTSVTEATAWTDLLSSIWDDEVRDSPGGVLPLSYRIDGRFRRVYGRPRRFTPTYDKLHLGKVYISADWALAEDTYYDEDEQTVTAQMAPSGVFGAGVVLPQALPWIFSTQPVPRTMQIIIGGSKATWVTPVIYGPVINPWVQIGGTVWALRGTVPGGYTATLSGRPWDMGIYLSNGSHVPSMLDPRSRLSALSLKPGTYPVTYGGTDGTGSSKVIVGWRNAHRTM